MALDSAPVASEEGKPRPSVLVVDSDPKVLRGLTRLLSGRGFDVETLDDSRRVLARLDASPVDVVLTDRCMEGVTGAGVTREVPAVMGAAAPPVVLLEKPVHAVVLLQALERALSGG